MHLSSYRTIYTPLLKFGIRMWMVVMPNSIIPIHFIVYGSPTGGEKHRSIHQLIGFIRYLGKIHYLRATFRKNA